MGTSHNISRTLFVFGNSEAFTFKPGTPSVHGHRTEIGVGEISKYFLLGDARQCREDTNAAISIVLLSQPLRLRQFEWRRKDHSSTSLSDLDDHCIFTELLSNHKRLPLAEVAGYAERS
jgi:hypothetical protein